MVCSKCGKEMHPVRIRKEGIVGYVCNQVGGCKHQYWINRKSKQPSSLVNQFSTSQKLNRRIQGMLDASM